MCGINGIISRNNDSLASQISRMNALIAHRGPDDSGVYIYENTVAFGMQRLSIIDIAHGKQPISNTDKSLVIVFNGEIYNFLQLKNILSDKGVQFNTSSDTEVVLKMYELFGEDAVKQLNGMFAFSIHNKKNKKIFIARDRVGEKPLYYTRHNDEIIWSSELKSIIQLKPELKNISKESLQLFLSLSYIPAPHTIYKDVFKLEPGCTMVIDVESLNITIKKYWDLEIPNGKQLVDYGEARKQLKDLLFDSVEKRMIADVPVGVFLSGGVDSTIVSAVMSKVSDQKIKTFTIAYKNKRYDESDRARVVAKHIKSEHYECLLDYDEVIGNIDKVILNYDEPYADSSCLPTYFISQKTSAFVKVALTGDGGDEVFAGYNKYLLHTYGRIYQKIVPGFIKKNGIEKILNVFSGRSSDTKSLVTKARKMLESLGGDVVSNHVNIIQLGFNNEALVKLLNTESELVVKGLLYNIISSMPTNFESNLQKARYIDTKISLEGDLLVKVDRASMLSSLECRAPFLDHRIMEFSYGIPDNFLIKGRNKKRLLKDTFSSMLPDNFFSSPKAGFEVPIGQWLRNELKEEINQTLSKTNLASHSFFNWEYVETLITDHLSGKIDHSIKIWTLYCFQKWYKANF